LALASLVVIAILNVGFRLYAVWTAHHIKQAVYSLRTLRLRETSRTEIYRMFPQLEPDGRGHFEADIFDNHKNPFIRIFQGNPIASELGHWLGVRGWYLSTEFCFRNDKLSQMSYHLLVGDRSFMPSTLWNMDMDSSLALTMGADIAEDHRSVWVSGKIVAALDPPVLSREFEQEGPLRIEPINSTSSFAQLVAAVDTPQNLVNTLFEVRLNCVWSFWGCRFAHEVLPAAFAAKETLKAKTKTRLLGGEPCPDRTVSIRVRNSRRIALTRVQRVQQVDEETVQADLPPLRMLRGSGDDDMIGKIDSFYIPMHAEPAFKSIPNPSVNLLKAGALIILFDRGVEACDLLKATPQQVERVEEIMRTDP